MNLILAALLAVTLAWEKPPDTSVVGYKLLYGPSSGFYTNSVSVGDTNRAVLSLNTSTRYFIAAVSVNTDGVESRPSNELEVQPEVSRKVFLIASTNLVDWAILCPVETTNAQQFLRLQERWVTNYVENQSK